MALILKSPEAQDLRPRITVFGVGGAGGNAVNNMIEKALEGAEFVVANTDAQALQQNRSSRKLQLGAHVTQGLGAGAKPGVGAQAAEESLEEIVDCLAGSHMCFITAGMGGGTGTGAAPVIARAAREMGILTVGVVTKPFQFEGAKRMAQAEAGIDQLQQVVDTLIIIPNQNLFRIANERTTFAEAFMMADDVLYQGVKGVTDLMVRPGLINLDFADVKAVMEEMGLAMMGTGIASGDGRAREAALKAITSPLLEDVTIDGARGVLMNITCGPDLTIEEVSEAASIVHEAAHEDAKIYFGTVFDMNCVDEMRITVIATGIQDGNAPLEKGTKVTPFAANPAANRLGAENEGSFIRPRTRKITVNESADLSVPAYIRAKTQPGAEEKRHEVRKIVNGGDDAEFLFEEEEFEIPSFIRMQAD